MIDEYDEPLSHDGRVDAWVPVWTAGQVAARLGVTESTLRSWHRRYGLEPRAKGSGAHRRYSHDDVTLLGRLRELVDGGMRPSVAAGLLNEMPVLREVQQSVVEAAKRLDTSTCVEVLTRTLHRWGVVRTWDRVCRPSLTSIERAQATDPDRVDEEHALSWSVTTALHRVRQPWAQARVLLACAPGEHHSLPVEALAAALAESDVPARVLGAAMPQAALVRAVTSTRPQAVLLWSHRPDLAHHRAAEAVAAAGPRLVVAGPGWGVPHPGWVHPGSLSSAVMVLGEAHRTTDSPRPVPRG
ncbi:MerR family transcriptional regulator [Saccharothrix violaceirubra]